MDELPDIQTGISKPDLFEAFKLQLRKDFEACGLQAGFVSQFIPEYDFVFNLLSHEIEKISRGAKLMELLYRIDLSEKQVNKMVKENPDKSFYDLLAELIIKRELQKVVIKQYYKNK